MATTFLQVKDGAESTLASGITAAAVSMTVAAGEGSKFPASGQFIVTIENEKILCDSVSTDTITINASGRGYETTTAATHALGTAVKLNVVATNLQDAYDAINTAENAIDAVEANVTTLQGAEFESITVAKGDLLTRQGVGNGALAPLVIGSSGQRLGVSSGLPAWVDDDGWREANETWTYASATTVTVSSDVTGKYGIGDKVKLTQTTVKYFYITAISYSSPNTTITLTAGTSYTVANAAITLPYYSKTETPQGFPHFFAYTPTWSTTGNQPSIGNGSISGKFTFSGELVTITIGFFLGSSSTTGTGEFQFTSPFPSDNLTFFIGSAWAVDIGTSYYIGSVRFANSASTMIIYSHGGTAGWQSTIPFTWSPASNDFLYFTCQFKP